MKVHHFNGLLWNFMIFHELTHNSMKMHKNGAFCAPGPRTYWIPKDFQWFWRHPSPRKCTEITKTCGISRISRIFTKKRKWRKFTISCQFRVLEWRSPPETSPDVTFIKGFHPGGEEAPTSAKYCEINEIQLNVIDSMKFNYFSHITSFWWNGSIFSPGVENPL